MASAVVKRNVLAGLKLVLRHSLFVYIFYNLYSRLSHALALACGVSIFWRIFCEHACGHRYLSHKSYRCDPWLLQVMVCTIATRDMGPLFYWFFLHNHHHTHCDTGNDLHSPKHSSFWCVHFNFAWSAAEADRFKLFEKLPENSPRSFKQLQTCYDADLSWLTMKRSLAIMLGEIFLWMGLGMVLSRSGYDVRPFELWAWLNFVPRVLTHHAVSLTNSAAHSFGSRPYTGRPDSPYPLCEATNCWWAAWLNGGEGWHSNHHAFALSARHGLLWWEMDMVYIGLYVLGHLGLVWDLKTVDDSIRLAPRGSYPEQKIDKHPKVKYALLFPSSKAS